MEAVVLASGSSGNAVLVRSGTATLLVDAGVSALQVRRRLEAFGRDLGELTAVLITHEHSDHVRGLEVLLKRTPVPVWATAGTWAELPVRSRGGGELLSGRSIALDGLSITPVATSHDAREPVAFVFDDGDHRFGLCTDTGTFTGLLAERMAGCDVLLVEANHDVDLLRNGPYPWSLKQRISSRLGHLSNEQCAEALERLRSPSLRAVIGLHLSAENNLPTMVCDALGCRVASGVPVAAVPRSEMLRITRDGHGVVLDRRPIPHSTRSRS
jgi:phosphoribosyl 1,2-cyclic phosphodiesterase